MGKNSGLSEIEIDEMIEGKWKSILQTIFKIADKENKEFIERIINDNRINNILHLVSGSEDGQSEYYYNMNKKIIKFSDAWYEYFDGVWNCSRQSHILSKLVSSKIGKNELKELYEICKRLLGIKDISIEINKTLSKFKFNIENAYSILGKKTKISNIEEICKKRFLVKDFSQKLDKRTDILAFKNGVFDLKTMQFRKHKPSDYLSKTINYNFKKIDDIQKDEKCAELMSILSQILTEKEKLDYTLKMISSSLSESQQKFYLWLGKGSNGKSILTKLIDLTFNTYYTAIPRTFWTERDCNSSAPNEVLMKIRDSKIAIAQEVEDGRFQLSKLKELTGSTSITARKLYSAVEEFYIKVNFICCLNNMPYIPKFEEAEKRRFLVTKFNSKFTENEKEIDNKTIFKADLGLFDKLQNYRNEFMNILIHYNKKYKKEGLQIPEIIQKETKEELLKGDFVYDFIKDKTIEKQTNGMELEEIYRKKLFVQGRRLLEELRSWCYGQNFKYDAKLAKEKLKTYLAEHYRERCFGKRLRNIYIGITLKKEDDSEDEEDDTEDDDKKIIRELREELEKYKSQNQKLQEELEKIKNCKNQVIDVKNQIDFIDDEPEEKKEEEEEEEELDSDDDDEYEKMILECVNEKKSFGENDTFLEEKLVKIVKNKKTTNKKKPKTIVKENVKISNGTTFLSLD